MTFQATGNTATAFFLPDLRFEAWPFKRRVNPHHELVAPSSAQWINSFKVFDDKDQRSFDACNLGLLTSMAYPDLKAAHLRIACDFLNALFALDDISDHQSTREVEVEKAIIMDALR